MAKKSEAVKPSEVRPSISAKKLKELLASGRSTKADIAELSGTFGEQIAAAVEKNHLHRKAFRVVMMADRMEPEKLADFLDCLEHYLDISGLNARAASAPRLPTGGDPTELDADEAEQRRAAGGDAKGVNVRAFPQPRGEAAE